MPDAVRLSTPEILHALVSCDTTSPHRNPALISWIQARPLARLVRQASAANRHAKVSDRTKAGMSGNPGGTPSLASSSWAT